MSQKEVRSVQEKVLKRVDRSYEGWVNGQLLLRFDLSLGSTLKVRDLISEGWEYIDARVQTIY